MTFSIGGMAIPVREFPGVEIGKQYPPNSDLLKGKFETHIKPYALINLGFTFGPIGNGGSGSQNP